jgi:F-type H+-transporting ATPase subunit epsilon
MSGLHLEIRTPVALVFEGPVETIRAEDLSGWFGIRPGRRDLAAVLSPGLLLFEQAGSERYVALAGGLLDLAGERCRVMAREAVMSDRLEEIAEDVARHERAFADRSRSQRDVFDDLAREALRRLRRKEVGR